MSGTSVQRSRSRCWGSEAKLTSPTDSICQSTINPSPSPSPSPLVVYPINLFYTSSTKGTLSKCEGRRKHEHSDRKGRIITSLEQLRAGPVRTLPCKWHWRLSASFNVSMEKRFNVGLSPSCTFARLDHLHTYTNTGANCRTSHWLPIECHIATTRGGGRKRITGSLLLLDTGRSLPTNGQLSKISTKTALYGKKLCTLSTRSKLCAARSHFLGMTQWMTWAGMLFTLNRSRYQPSI